MQSGSVATAYSVLVPISCKPVVLRHYLKKKHLKSKLSKYHIMPDKYDSLTE